MKASDLLNRFRSLNVYSERKSDVTYVYGWEAQTTFKQFISDFMKESKLKDVTTSFPVKDKTKWVALSGSNKQRALVFKLISVKTDDKNYSDTTQSLGWLDVEAYLVDRSVHSDSDIKSLTPKSHQFIDTTGSEIEGEEGEVDRVSKDVFSPSLGHGTVDDGVVVYLKPKFFIKDTIDGVLPTSGKDFVTDVGVKNWASMMKWLNNSK